MWDCESRPTSGTVLSILLLPLIAAGLLPAQTPIRGSVHPQVQRAADLGPVSEETILPLLVQWSDGNPGAILQMLKMAHLPQYRAGNQIKAHVLYLDYRMGRR